MRDFADKFQTTVFFVWKQQEVGGYTLFCIVQYDFDSVYNFKHIRKVYYACMASFTSLNSELTPRVIKNKRDD